MNSFATYLTYLPKKMVGIVSALAIAALVTTAVSAAFGPDRPTKPWLGNGTSGFDHVTFNSFTGVPDFGDERDFMRGKLNGSSAAYADPVSGLQDGDQVKVLVYIHNGADGSLNADGTGVAENLRVRVELPGGTAASQDITGFISATNASPQQIFDTVTLSGSEAFSMEYVAGSAMIRTADLGDVALSDDLVSGGVLIGDDALDGKMKGCFEYLAYVTFLVTIEVPDEPEQPIFECSSLTALPAAVKPDEDVKFTATANAANGATITKYVFNFGDGNSQTVTSSAENTSVTHAYDDEGSYNANVTVHFTVDGQEKTDSGNKCKTTVKVDEKEKPVCPTDPSLPADSPKCDEDEPEPEMPEVLPDTGIGSALAGFFGTSALFASARELVNSRRQLRASALKR